MKSKSEIYTHRLRTEGIEIEVNYESIWVVCLIYNHTNIMLKSTMK